jgi:hypothetical protein
MPNDLNNYGEEHETSTPPNVGDVLADAVLNALAGSLGKYTPKQIKDMVKALLSGWVLPTLHWRTRVEGSCSDLCSAIIELVSQYPDNTSTFTGGITALGFGVSIEVQLKGQVVAANYRPCPSACDTSPRHAAWKKEMEEVKRKQEEWNAVHDKWKAEIEEYRKHPAFKPDGEPYPTPQWPPDVDGFPPVVPWEPPTGVQRCREFYVLWTAEFKFSAGFVAAGAITRNIKVGDTTEVVCTRCCEPGPNPAILSPTAGRG